MADPFSWAMLAVATIGSFVSYGMQASAAQAQADAASATAQAQVDELTRQQGEALRIAEEEKGDRARQADRELATLRVLAGERGGLQTNTYLRQVQELGYIEGLDLSRITQSAENTVDSLQASKKAAQMGALNVATEAKNATKAAGYGAVLNTASSGLQIGASSYQAKTYEQILAGTKSAG